MRNAKRVAVHVALAVTLVIVGWAVGRGQTVAPDFELIVDAPGGETTIQCAKGCTLAWVERGVNPSAIRMRTFKYGCTGSRCSSARVGGWLNR
jgi:hypothetical protein